jgi:hypothetical protein
MCRKAESDPFTFLQLKLIPSFPDQIWDKQQFLSDGFCYLLRHPSRITSACEIEYHGAKLHFFIGTTKKTGLAAASPDFLTN